MPPTAAQFTLNQLRERLRTLVVKATGVGFDAVLREANSYGWDRLLTKLSHVERVDLVRRMAKAVSEQQKLMEAMADAYDRTLVTVTEAAEDEIQRLDDELQRLEHDLWASRAVAVSRHRGPSWLTVALAGLGGYWLARKD